MENRHIANLLFIQRSRTSGLLKTGSQCPCRPVLCSNQAGQQSDCWIIFNAADSNTMLMSVRRTVEQK